MSKKEIKSIIEKYAEPLNDNYGGCILAIRSNNFKKMIKDLNVINNTFTFTISGTKLVGTLGNELGSNRGLSGDLTTI